MYYMNIALDWAKEEWVMHSKHDISTIKTMTLAERKEEAMRQLKASFDRAAGNGSLHKREVPAS